MNPLQYLSEVKTSEGRVTLLIIGATVWLASSGLLTLPVAIALAAAAVGYPLSRGLGKGKAAK